MSMPCEDPKTLAELASRLDLQDDALPENLHRLATNGLFALFEIGGNHYDDLSPDEMDGLAQAARALCALLQVPCELVAVKMAGPLDQLM